MSTRRTAARVAAWAVAAAAVVAGSGLGQPPGKPPETAPPPAPAGGVPPIPPAPERVPPDPTVPGPGLREVLSPPKGAPGTGPAAAEPKAAELKLRGRIIAGSRASVAIEIDGALYTLPVGGEVQGLKVLEIAADGVKVEIAKKKEIRVLH